MSRIDIPYIKSVQGGGSMEGFREVSRKYKKMLCVVITDTNDAQTNQAKSRLLNEYGCDAAYIATKKNEIEKFSPINGGGILVSNKTEGSILATIKVMSGNPSNNFLLWDEPDYDAPGHTESSEKIKKHNHLNKVRLLANEVHYITATLAGLVVSPLVFNEPKIIDKKEGYLSFNDFNFVNLGDEDVSEMLISGDISPTLKKFIRRTAHEGLFVRTCREVANMALVKKSIQSLVDVPVEVLNGSNKYLDYKNFKGVLISFAMGARGLTALHLRHGIFDISAGTTQPTVVQAWRMLGYDKIGSNGNYVAGSTETLARCRTAFKFEEELKNIMQKYYNDPVLRHEKIAELELDLKMTILPKNKSNGFITEIGPRYIQKQTLDYSSAVEDALIAAKVLHSKVVEGNGEWYKGGNRDTEKAISDIINNSPNSPSGLNKSNYQKISPEYALQRLSSKEQIKELKEQWGHIFDPITGKPIELTLWGEVEDKKYLFKR